MGNNAEYYDGRFRVIKASEIKCLSRSEKISKENKEKAEAEKKRIMDCVDRTIERVKQECIERNRKHYRELAEKEIDNELDMMDSSYDNVSKIPIQDDDDFDDDLNIEF